jgi:hypothetical protein
MLDSEVDSARRFVRLWLVLSVLVLIYAWLDLRLTPRLSHETEFTMNPDWQRLPDLLHWGGRLLNHGALSLLVGNAIVLSGAGALAVLGLLRFLRSVHGRQQEPSVSVVPAPTETSVPPPPGDLRARS